MTNKKNKNNSNCRCKDYEMFADDYFRSIFSKKSSLGHSKYVQHSDSDSCSKSSNYVQHSDSDSCSKSSNYVQHSDSDSCSKSSNYVQHSDSDLCSKSSNYVQHSDSDLCSKSNNYVEHSDSDLCSKSNNYVQHSDSDLCSKSNNYVQHSDFDLCSKSSNKDNRENYSNCNNTLILTDDSEPQNISKDLDFTMSYNFYDIKKDSHEGKKCYIDEELNNDYCDSSEEEFYQKDTHKSSFNDNSSPYSYDYENIDKQDDNKSCKCKEDSVSEPCNKEKICGYPHNHEITGSVNFTGSNNKRHNHRTCGLTSDAIKCDNSHVHNVHLYTDTSCRHIHEICETTSKAICLPNGKHFHIIKGSTQTSDGHIHEYYFLTFIDDPSLI